MHKIKIIPQIKKNNNWKYLIYKSFNSVRKNYQKIIVVNQKIFVFPQSSYFCIFVCLPNIEVICICNSNNIHIFTDNKVSKNV